MTDGAVQKSENTTQCALRDPRPLIAHVVYRFDVGGLENGVVNLINNMPLESYRHVVISLTEVTDFRQRVLRKDVQFIALEKPPGHALWLYPKLIRLFRELRPDIVHTRNLAALEVVIPAWAAGVPVRIHSEHGREGADVSNANTRYRVIRKIYKPFVTYFLALSRDLENYLKKHVGIPETRLAQIYNGVDTHKFMPASTRSVISGAPFSDENLWVIGTVGRIQAVKDQATLVRAFAQAVSLTPALRSRLRLVIVGDGPMRNDIFTLVNQLGIADLTWMPGGRNDIPELLRGLDCFVLPSLSEGISNTILEAMATGLPVIATDTGGNPELIDHQETGLLVGVKDVSAMANAIVFLALSCEKAKQMGMNGRDKVVSSFSIDSMVRTYCRLYDQVLRPCHLRFG